jgi:hypothetical protein
MHLDPPDTQSYQTAAGATLKVSTVGGGKARNLIGSFNWHAKSEQKEHFGLICDHG